MGARQLPLRRGSTGLELGNVDAALRLGSRQLQVSTVEWPRFAEETLQRAGDLERVVEHTLGHRRAGEAARSEAEGGALDGVTLAHPQVVEDELLGFRGAAGFPS